MLTTTLAGNQIRIIENNDWVIIVLLICAFGYIFMMNTVQRNAKLKDFLMQQYYDSPNNFASWVITSVIYCLCLSVLISQYIPIVPEMVSKMQIMGLQFNKIGYAIIIVSSFYFIKSCLSFLFYQSIGEAKKWPLLYFTSTKFFFIFSLILMAASIMHYYFPIDKNQAFIYYLIALAIIFIFKLFFLYFHKSDVLPQKWYYKFLYICTLQIIPLLGLWKLLFF